MPSTTRLEVPGASHSRLMVAPPRLNLRRTGSYNLLEKGPLSATSSTYNFNSHFFFSPPPSPSLPALVPRPRKSPVRPRPSRVLRLLVWAVGALAVLYLGVAVVLRLGPVVTRGGRSGTGTGTGNTAGGKGSYHPQEDAAMVGQDEVPDFPTPVMVSSPPPLRKPQWTVSIPENYRFPLAMGEYAEVCEQCRDVSVRTREARSSRYSYSLSSGRGDAGVDPHFVDVLEAQQSGLLPGHRLTGQGNQAAVWRAGDLVGLHANTMAKPVCKQTMTFVLESADAGLGKSLLLLWTLYGLAKQQERAFFVDDTRWAYDKYTSMFQPPPVPACRPPSRQAMIPCPAQARHLVVTSATALDLFPDLAGEPLPDEPQPDYDARSKRLFELARTGYEALFHMAAEDRDYVGARLRDLADKALKVRKVVVGAHIRHGDRHPTEAQYAESYVPSHVFSDKAQELLAAKAKQTAERFNYGNSKANSGAGTGVNVASRQKDSPVGNGGVHPQHQPHQRQAMMVVASDDPVVYESDELAGSFRAQERIRLASKSLIQKLSPDWQQQQQQVNGKFVDEAFGWEGGFFAAMFWNLGKPPAPAAHDGGEGGGDGQGRPAASPEVLRLRSLVGRAYVMDLAVVAGASDVVVCTASATGCRLLAVMMGWDRAIEGGNWVNVDGEYGWSGIEG